MRVLQLGKFYPPDIGGIENVIFEITEGLNDRDISTDVLCSNSSNYYIEGKIKNYKVYRTKSYGKIASTSISPQMIFKLKEIINYYDVVYVHLPDPMANIALFLADNRKAKIVVHWHSDIIRQKFLLKFYLPLQRWLLKRADRIIATTPKYICESKYLKEFIEKTVAIPIGIDRSKLVINKNIISTLRSRFKGKKVIFSLGRFVYYKGFEYLVKSALYLQKDFIIIIGGDGELRRNIEKLIRKLQLEDKVILPGKIPVDHLGSYYKVCDIFTLPSITKSEAFGVAIIEAMSFAKPIVATKIKGSGVDWVNKHMETGINVEPKNSKQLAMAFIKLLTDKPLYIKFSQNALYRFNNYFTKERMISSISKTCDEILGG